MFEDISVLKLEDIKVGEFCNRDEEFGAIVPKSNPLKIKNLIKNYIYLYFIIIKYILQMICQFSSHITVSPFSTTMPPPPISPSPPHHSHINACGQTQCGCHCNLPQPPLHLPPHSRSTHPPATIAQMLLLTCGQLSVVVVCIMAWATVDI